jgi:peptide/nickel transport system permease protein
MTLLRYLVRRALLAIVVLVGVSVLSFGVMFLSGDPTAVLVPSNWTKEQIQTFRHQMGYDRPWIVQYADYAWKALHGDFGYSLRQRRPVFPLILERMPATLQLTLSAMALSVLVSIPAGILAARRHGSWMDSLTMAGALVGQSVPVFWLGLMLIILFGVKLKWLPVSGRGSLAHLIMPTIVLAFWSIGRMARLVRSCMLEVLATDYVRTARAKGLSEQVVLYRHAFRNALLPVITLVGLEVGTLLGGAVVTETIFSWPGVGRLTINAIYGKDFPLVQGAVLLLATGFVVINLLVDVSYVILDPRVQLR